MTKVSEPSAAELATFLFNVKNRPAIRLWPDAARLRGVSRAAIYSAAKRGEIDTIRTGRRICAVSASLRRELRIDP